MKDIREAQKSIRGKKNILVTQSQPFLTFPCIFFFWHTFMNIYDQSYMKKQYYIAVIQDSGKVWTMLVNVSQQCNIVFSCMIDHIYS